VRSVVRHGPIKPGSDEPITVQTRARFCGKSVPSKEEEGEGARCAEARQARVTARLLGVSVLRNMPT